ncbi:MAG TPA: CDP-alcohol phosphatidyltransferase family protein [Thermoanaerobaculia bacterium]|nr:CDP-alcohol phosphatidyltransferase family protein [Thermoanaerobaculia bacterium]
MSLTIPNLLSLLRMALVPVFIIAVRYGEPKKALLIFLFAGITDALDGFIARIAKQQSLLGMYLDPIADKLLLTSAWVVLAIPNLAQAAPVPIWVTILVISRDILIVIVALVLYLALGVRKFPPSVISKMTTVVQVATVGVVLVAGIAAKDALRFAVPLDFLADFFIYLTAALTLVSGLYYVYRSGDLVSQKDRAAE